MDDNILDFAANFLQDITPAEDQQETAYVVDVTNPVCPHCGAKLILNDGVPAAESNQLSTEQITESFATADDVLPLVKETAEEIMNSFLEQDFADPKELVYITDPTIKSVIHRKAIELCSILENNYGFQVTTAIVETHIKEMLKFLVNQVQ